MKLCVLQHSSFLSCSIIAIYKWLIGNFFMFYSVVCFYLLIGAYIICYHSILPVIDNFNAELPCCVLFLFVQFREYILGDIISGLSVGVMTIPQSMGYSLLANMPAKFGLYSSLFPVLVYFMFGTSRHVSLGTMALNSLLIQAAISRNVGDSVALNVTGNETADMQ